MDVFYRHGSKERLFEMMTKVNRLNEELLPNDKKNEIINDFVKYVSEKLGFNNVIPKIKLSYDENDAQEMKSFGEFNPEDNTILVVAANRNLADVLRTIAHELVHQKQKEDGKLKPNSGETGSPEENEANSLAGVFLREFGKNNSIIFE